MKSSRFDILPVLVGILVVTASFAVYKAFYYRNLYLNDPQVKTKTVEKNSIINRTNFDPNRAQAYTCRPQPVTPEGYGMVCSSPDRSILVQCSVTAGQPVEYFC